MLAEQSWRIVTAVTEYFAQLRAILQGRFLANSALRAIHFYTENIKLCL